MEATIHGSDSKPNREEPDDGREFWEHARHHYALRDSDAYV
jgi:hypothetical protein